MAHSFVLPVTEALKAFEARASSNGDVIDGVGNAATELTSGTGDRGGIEAGEAFVASLQNVG
jgi:hypothetical protein